MVTLALATKPPDWSVTTPRTRPVLPCGSAGLLRSATEKSAVTATASLDRRRCAGTVFRRLLETMRTSPTTRNRYRRCTTIREGLSSDSLISRRKRSDGAPDSMILVYWYDHSLLRYGRRQIICD